MASPAVVVVGGGPGGLAAAIALARHDVPTLLVERRVPPLDKPCGEGLLPSAVQSLLALGVPRAELERRGRRIAGIRYVATSGRAARASFPPGMLALGLSRRALSELLLARARELPTLRVQLGASAVVDAGDRPSVRVGRERHRPALVVGADGLHSSVRRACRMPSAQGARRRYGVRQHFAFEPWSADVEVYFSSGAEAYVTPLAGGVNVALLWTRREGSPRAEDGRVFPALLERFPRLAERLRGHEPIDRASGAGAFEQRPRARARPGLVLLGDAAGYIDALTGEGVGLALAQALSLERVLAPLLAPEGARRLESGAVVPLEALASHFAAVDEKSATTHQLTRVMLALIERPRLLEAAIAVLSHSGGLFRHLLGASSGQHALWHPGYPWLAALAEP